ncbi:MAG: hypothetical protein KatS3mg105_2664 [Gemmatales bacterium]|nr:MAG: hypothetical protein KatS3mg105_2664 [Gemmatales bacterium]
MPERGLCCSRRHFLASQALGIGGLALSWLLNEERLGGEPPRLEKPTFNLEPKPPHRQPRAKAMISLWMQGGPSHIDLCDPKPELAKLDGQKIPGGLPLKGTYKQREGRVMASPWKFKKFGQSGIEFSELLPHIGSIADDITLIRSMYAPTVNNHVQSIRAFQRADKSNRLGNSDRPSLGSWITYALGSESQNLPAFVAMTDDTMPIDGLANWTNGFLPSLYQGTVVRPREPRIVNLEPPTYLKGEPQEDALKFLERLNRRHLSRFPNDYELEARIATFQLAAKMQLAATEAMDLSSETEETHRLYGLDDPVTRQYGMNCLLARRLIERGVRFVQIFTGSQYWDHHSRIISDLPKCCRRTDKPAAALVTDLKRRGLLETTIVHWGGEMGRLPVIQGNGTNKAVVGRDHNVYGFSMWLAGGGFKAGYVHGETDEFGFQAVKDRVGPADYLATLACLFGLDAEQVVYNDGFRENSLMDGQKFRIVSEILKNPA